MAVCGIRYGNDLEVGAVYVITVPGLKHDKEFEVRCHRMIYGIMYEEDLEVRCGI